MTKGPYAAWQQPAMCGCYFPDVTRLSDDKETGLRTLHCIYCGTYTIPWDTTQMRPERYDVPSSDWRVEKRAELMAGGGRIVLCFHRVRGPEHLGGLIRNMFIP